MKLLVYEQEYFKTILEKSEQKLLLLRRDKSYLLDQLLQYEQVTLSDNESSDELSDADFQPVVSNFSLPQRPPSSSPVRTTAAVSEQKKAAAGTGRSSKLTVASKRGARGVVEGGGSGQKRIGTKRGAPGPVKASAKKERLKAATTKSTNKVKGLEVKTILMTNQKPINENFDDEDEDDQLVISLPRPAASTVTSSPGPIPNLPPSQFLDTSSSSSSSNDSSSSASGDSSGSEDEESDYENTPKNNGSTDNNTMPLVKCSSVTHPLGDHAYGAPPTHNSRLQGEQNSTGPNEAKMQEVKNDTIKTKQNSITAKPTPQRPSVLVSTMKGYNLGTIPSSTSQLSLSPNSANSFFKWSNRPDHSPSSGSQDSSSTPVLVGFTPIVGGNVVRGEEQLSPNLNKSTLMSPRASAFHVVSPTKSSTSTANS